jgi:co-chaperonin GroES (HSP10)
LKRELKFVPSPGRLICKEDNFKYSGRLVIPESAQRRPTVGTIVGIGKGVDEMYVTGQRIVYGLYSGTVISFKGQPAIRVLGQDEILTIVEGDEIPELEGVGV